MHVNKMSDAGEYGAGRTLLERVREVCDDLAAEGWGELLKAHGLDIKATDLEAELLRPLDGIDRRLGGFQDFSFEGRRGIEPGKPAQSLLFHALASPQVVTGVGGAALSRFPTPAQIEAVENYVYGIRPPSIQDLRVMAGGAPLAIVVFASEYRPAVNTVHQKHADMCFSRVGVSRVGTAPCEYLPHARGYLPFVEGNPHAVSVIPCRFAAYVAAQLPGQKSGFGPLRFLEGGPVTRDFDGDIRTIHLKSDSERSFWVPLHKLFSGGECMRGVNLTLTLTPRHVNEKLRRVHRALAAQGIDTGWHEPDISQPPFTFTDGLAEFSTSPSDGHWLLTPVARPSLVERAEYAGETLTYKVPVGNEPFRSSLNIGPRRSGARAAPEYVHARHSLDAAGKIIDLNDQPKVEEVVGRGGYRAVHYIDYTADGSVEVECPELAFDIPRSLAAYSMIAAVDYFPLVKQQELMQWWEQSIPPELEKNIWPKNPGPPLTMCDIRYPANQSLTLKKLNIQNEERNIFDSEDDTMTAIIGFRDAGAGRMTQVDPARHARVSWLPDGAAGIFAPGWDCSIDRTEEFDPSDDGALVLPGTTYLSNYGLGSPFPEDSMLCAALSSFWPAAAPDITRTFAPGKYATATPLTDNIIGVGGSDSWDGVPGPRISDEAKKLVEYTRIEYGDYVQTALRNRFNLEQIGRTTAAEYSARTLCMARVYTCLGAIKLEQKIQWALFSFTHAEPDDADLLEAESQTDLRLNPTHAYRFKIFEHKETDEVSANHRTKLVRYEKMLLIFADPQTVLKQDDDGKWKAFRY